MKLLAKGFTLIELVTVLVLLGVLSVGISGFIGVTTQIYVDVTTRDELISSARFSIERLNRELRGALPNSIRTLSSGNSQCVEFTPAKLSAVYTQLAVAPDPASDQINIVRFFDTSLYSDSLDVIVYPLTPDDVYNSSDRRASIDNLNQVAGNEWVLTLSASKQFPQNSPTSRVYFIESPVAYCVTTDSAGLNGSLTRHQGYSSYSANLPSPFSDGVLMAASLNTAGSTPFQFADSTRQRNAIVLVNFTFEENFESISFNNEIQVPNVP